MPISHKVEWVKINFNDRMFDLMFLPVFNLEILSAGLGGSAFHPGAVICIPGFAGRGAGCWNVAAGAKRGVTI